MSNSPHAPSSQTSPPGFCPQCGAPLASDVPSGLCPRCVMGLAFAARPLDLPATGGELDAPPLPGVAPPGPPTSPWSDRPSGTSFGRPTRFAPPTPQQLAAYFPHLEILELVGQGGMGAVYKARQRGLDRLVALKILPPEAAEDPAFAERFHREARALARLSHPNIVGIHDSGRAGPFYYFLMEFVDGVNLRQAMRAGRLQPSEALRIIPQICEALQYAHDEGVVHRDIKPENVLLDLKGRIKVADFGLAKLLSHEPIDVTLTGTHQVVGTPRYMAPEQMEGTRCVDHRADIYSLGVVFYELLTGELPLGRFPMPSARAPVTQQVDNIVLRTLEKEPQARYQHASELKTDVERLSGARSTGVSAGHIPEGLYRNSSVWGINRFGTEYRSRATVFGIPWIHMASGIDPATGKARRAVGVIAIGGHATGVIAVGGFARGGIAIGGIAIGGIAMGGLTLGLFAIGGFAFGLLAALGGLALGTFAQGGIALNLLGSGGPLDGGATPPWLSGTSRRGFGIGALELLLVVGIGLFFPALVIVFVVMLARGRTERSPRSEQGLPERDFGRVPPVVREPLPPRHATESQGGLSWLWIILLLVMPLCCLGGVAAPALLLLAPVKTVRVTPSSPSVSYSSRAIQPNVDEEWNWDWSDDGPRLPARFQAQMGLDYREQEIFQEIAIQSWRRYLEMEATLRESRVNADGHHETLIKPLSPIQFAELENGFWSQVDPLLSESQQRLARRKLPLANHTTVNGNLQVSLLPGLFGWGKAGVRIELWRVGQWHHWKVNTPVNGAFPTIGTNGLRHEYQGPTLPAQYARFLPAGS